MMTMPNLVLSDITPELMPEILQNDVYYVGNDASVQREIGLKHEISLLQDTIDPWKCKALKLYSEGVSVREIARQIKKQQAQISRTINSLQGQQLIHHWQHLDVIRDGPNEHLRREMLWRLAVDNEKKDPKECTKALAELNKMAAPKNSSGQSFNIVITNNVLQKGPLDG